MAFEAWDVQKTPTLTLLQVERKSFSVIELYPWGATWGCHAVRYPIQED